MPLEIALKTRIILYPDSPIDLRPNSNFEDFEAFSA
jgi:hypothetical protein